MSDYQRGELMAVLGWQRCNVPAECVAGFDAKFAELNPPPCMTAIDMAWYVGR